MNSSLIWSVHIHNIKVSAGVLDNLNVVDSFQSRYQLGPKKGVASPNSEQLLTKIILLVGTNIFSVHFVTKWIP